jgi:hypothetical protein
LGRESEHHRPDRRYQQKPLSCFPLVNQCIANGSRVLTHHTEPENSLRH